ncbi:hypothetical protein FQN50_007938 [Emmonsiellopsis sp. PD_5]|nr:hypothetical protein FQN50_007938 [Emmonsiellopsis sp. PD_5]
MGKKKIRGPSPENQVHTLSSLLAVQVLDTIRYLTLFHLLQLSSCNHPQIDPHILAHLTSNGVLQENSNQKDFQIIKRYFNLYCTIYNLLKLPKSPNTSPLSTSLSLAPNRTPINLKLHLHRRIFVHLGNSVQYAALLTPFTNAPLAASDNFLTLNGLEAHWRVVQDAQYKFNGVKAGQLRRMADIFEKYPDLVRFARDPRWTLPPGGGNVGHTVARLRLEAVKIMRDHPLRPRHTTRALRSTSLFWPNTVQVVPVEGCLRMFVNGVEKFPPAPGEIKAACKGLKKEDEDDDMQNVLSSLKLNDGERGDVVHAHSESPTSSPSISHHPDTATGSRYHEYPGPILRDLYTAIKGLKYVYLPEALKTIPETISQPTATATATPGPCDPLPHRCGHSSCVRKPTPQLPQPAPQPFKIPRIPRTHNTPYSASPSNHKPGIATKRPCFVVPDRLNELTSHPSREVTRELVAIRGTPHDEREFDWLEAFLRCCRYLEGLGVVS